MEKQTNRNLTPKNKIPIWQRWDNSTRIKEAKPRIGKREVGTAGGSSIKSFRGRGTWVPQWFELLPSAQGVIPGSWDQVLHRAPSMELASLSSACVCLSRINKIFQRKKENKTKQKCLHSMIQEPPIFPRKRPKSMYYDVQHSPLSNSLTGGTPLTSWDGGGFKFLCLDYV